MVKNTRKLLNDTIRKKQSHIRTLFRFVKTEDSANAIRMMHIIQRSIDQTTDNNSIELFKLIFLTYIEENFVMVTIY